MGLLAVELVALVLLFAADDVVHGRAPAATWALSARVVGASVLAVALVSWLQTAARGDIF